MQPVSEPVPGLLSIKLPLPFELKHVNVGLVRLAGGWMLIDTGLDTAESFDALSAALASRGIAWTDIRRILVTHMHPDHIGSLGRLRSLTGAQVMMHRDEIELVNSVVDAGRPPWIDEGLRLAGTPQAMVDAIHDSLAPLRGALRRVTADVVLEGGEEFETALGPARIFWTPGHSVGLVCVYFPHRQVLWSADHMIEKITPNIGWLPGRDCLAEFLTSLREMIPHEITMVIPSHGEPFSGHVAWVAQTIDHHEERCDILQSAVGRETSTAHELVPALWSRVLSPFHYHFALFEVLAHLEYMERRGRIRKTLREDGVLEWQPAA